MIAQEVFRERLVAALRQELVGPDWLTPGNGESNEQPAEILQESPVQRYSAGVLFPLCQPIDEVEDTAPTDQPTDDGEAEAPEIYPEGPSSDSEREGRVAERISDAYDETVRLANEFFPSAFGLTFIANIAPHGILVRAHAAIYRSQAPATPEKRLREWHRVILDIAPTTLTIRPDEQDAIREVELIEHLKLRAIFHRRTDGAYLVTVSILNTRPGRRDKFPSGTDCFFQVGFDVSDPQGAFIFREYRSSARSFHDSEEAALELLYRQRTSYAAGHGCAVEWGSEHDGQCNRVATTTVPAFKVAPVEPRGGGGDELSMFFLSGAGGTVAPETVPTVVAKVADDYEAWILEREQEALSLPARLRDAAEGNIATCRMCLARIRTGIDLLRSDATILRAFVWANRVMLMQQHHSRRSRRGIDDDWQDFPTDYAPTSPKDGRWRAFQLAFVLMNLRSIVPLPSGEDHEERKLVDLIWFPTGGGKTEAYLGLSACDIFYRRLRNPASAGCTVLMRYTLRLLTAQQFQRASSMICACELLRRENASALGRAPISIGLWVGESLTPTRRADAVKAANDLVNKQGHADNPFQLLKCPWCGTELNNRKSLGYVPHGSPKSVAFVCPDRRCPFSTRDTRLPVLVVDEDIYDAPPTLIIGTVDKFAMLAWRGEAGSIFGIRPVGNVDPPDLIIQDELHLISGSLGSVVGLYEAAIDLLCSWRGRPPKIVASTATIRRADKQCQALYDRPTFQFPPQGINASDSFFAAENPAAPGRIYVGIFASASPSFVTAMVRTLSALFQSCLSTALPEGAAEQVRDPYWTVLQYFNSLRELGHAATLVEADIPEYMWAIASRDRIPKELCRRLGSPVELTSRLSADEIPEILERLTMCYPRTSDDAPRPLDTLLATNMISVGVDVDRLGLMVVVGQPKTTSEYIQASSRVGRSANAPGLVVTMYNPGKPRDRSHYEHFRSYHSAFYRHVEPTSVTPYALPVMERALHAVLVIVARHLAHLASPDALDVTIPALREAAAYLEERCRCIDEEHAPALAAKCRALLRHWDAVRPGTWGRFGRPPDTRPLMYPAGTDAPADWNDSAWPTPASMRSVDVECLARVVNAYEATTEEE